MWLLFRVDASLLHVLLSCCCCCNAEQYDDDAALLQPGSAQWIIEPASGDD